MKSDSGLENKLLHELINMPLSAFAQEGAGPLWFIKVVNENIFNQFLISCSKEYMQLFQKTFNPELPFEVKATPQKNQKEFETFFTDLIQPINDLMIEYLNQETPHFNTIVQAALAVINKALIKMSTQNEANPIDGPQFSTVFETIFKSVVNFHLEHAQQIIFKELSSIDFASFKDKQPSSLISKFSQTITSIFISYKLEGPLFPNQRTVIDSLYEHYFHFIFYGCLEIIQMKIEQLESRTINAALKNVKCAKIEQNGKILYLLSRVAREMSLQTIFEDLCQELAITHAEHSDFWLQFVVEKIPTIKERYDLYSIQLRKMFIDHYHEMANTIIVQYFDDLK